MAIHQDSRIEPVYISLREAARIYAVSTYTLRRRIASGDLPAVKLGYKIIRVRVADLDGLFPAIPTTRPEDQYSDGDSVLLIALNSPAPQRQVTSPAWMTRPEH